MNRSPLCATIIVLSIWFIFGPTICAASTPAEMTGLPILTGTVIGSPEPVFDTKTQSCEEKDIPDTQASAFRDDHNIVHLFSTENVARAMLGTSLDNVKRDCAVVFRSRHDPDPSHFQQNEWLASFFTEDGKHIAALVHMEYHGSQVPGMCAPGPKAGTRCWWNAVTFAQSSDGGYSFTTPPPPHNLIAAPPYRYDKDIKAGPVGYFGPTDIVKHDNYYYAFINDWGNKPQSYGSCLIRTADVNDPGSWRAWDGKGFTVRFIDPYTEPDAVPAQHVCARVQGAIYETASLVYHPRTGSFIVTQLTPDRRFGDPGVYVTASADLIHWSPPRLIISTAQLSVQAGQGRWLFEYASLLDPTSTDRNFSTVSDTPYVYIVRSDMNHPPLTRLLFRQKIRLNFGG
jgi:hypothetical protein